VFNKPLDSFDPLGQQILFDPFTDDYLRRLMEAMRRLPASMAERVRQYICRRIRPIGPRPCPTSIPDNANITPSQAYWGWAHGIHNGPQTYTEGPMIEAIKQHEGFQEIRDNICERMNACCEEGTSDYCNQESELAKMTGTGRKWYPAPRIEFFTFPIITSRVNPFVTDAGFLRAALGGFTRMWEVKSVDCCNRTVTVEFKAENTAGLASLTRDPRTGESLCRDAEGPTPLKQTFIWTEEIPCGD
jgi:hypothetical protein